MARDTPFTSFLVSLIGRNAASLVWRDGAQGIDSDPVALSKALLSSRGEASGVAIADRILALLEDSDEPAILAWFTALRREFEVDLDAVAEAAARAQSGDARAFIALQAAAEPARQELLRRLNAAPNGTARLVALRAQLLAMLPANPDLGPVDADLRHLLRSWFNRGFLLQMRIDWGTSAEVLEKIIAYEAVHAIDSWDDLRQRLVPRDRRCFAFFHPSMPKEPLIFVEVALTEGLATSIHDVLSPDREPLDPHEADTAIFYSISNCQQGLAGISFGAFLIKQVAADLARELPNLRQFSTLSPVPGLGRWLDSQSLQVTPDDPRLPMLAAHYLADARDAKDRPLDPVARFHLGNGAELHQINTLADLSPKGQRQSRGVMVNYLYELDRVEARHEAHVERGEVAVSRAVRNLRQKYAAAAKQSI